MKLHDGDVAASVVDDNVGSKVEVSSGLRFEVKRLGYFYFLLGLQPPSSMRYVSLGRFRLYLYFIFTLKLQEKIF